MELQQELQRIYDSEINVRIESFWDGGWRLLLGDALNGFTPQQSARTAEEIAPTLQAMIKEHYPDSAYARSIA
jgi:hypothetical protein